MISIDDYRLTISVRPIFDGRLGSSGARIGWVIRAVLDISKDAWVDRSAYRRRITDLDEDAFRATAEFYDAVVSAVAEIEQKLRAHGYFDR